MAGYGSNIESLTKNNTFFRKVLFTAKHMQLVVMSLAPKEEIGMETHPHTDQFIRVESGEGKCTIGDSEYALTDGVSVIIPAGNKHNVWNTSSSEDLKIYTIYSPPEHEDGTIHKTKEDAVKDEGH